LNIISRLARARVAMGAAAVAAALMLAAPLLTAAEPAPDAAAPEVLQPQLDPFAAQQAVAAAEQAALEDPAVKQVVEDLDAAVQAALRAADPEHEAKLARLKELEPLVAEAQALQQELVRAQAAVVESEPLAKSIEDAQAKVLAKMVEIDPKVREHLDALGAPVPQ
jgi:hypothetical protein